MFLKQSTAYTFRFGPFLDETDGKTAETGLTISQADIRLSKAGGNFAQKNESSSSSHDEIGYYIVVLDTTDTNTCGELLVACHESGALPVFKTFYVLEEAIYDALFAASASAFDSNARVDVASIEGSDATDQINAACDAAIETYGLDHLVSASVAGSDVTDNSIIARLVSKESTADWDDYVNTTDSLQALRDRGDSAWTTGGGGGASAADIADAVWDEAASGHASSGTFGKYVADILTDTAEIGSAGAGLTAVPWNSSWDAEVQSECTDALNAYDPPTKAEMDAMWTTAQTESYASDGAAATPAQLLYMIYCAVGEFAISSTTITGKKLDGSTTAMTWTINDASNPTSRTRAS
tara:strand:+ start:9044 stop:10102 length:1059 start_codon:yes stop_codon:yes gene_type:complete